MTQETWGTVVQLSPYIVDDLRALEETKQGLSHHLPRHTLRL